MSDAWRLIRKPSTAPRAMQPERKFLSVLRCAVMGMALGAFTVGAALCTAQQITNSALSVTVHREDGSYEFGSVGGRPTLRSSIGALVDHKWLHSGSYPS